MRLPRWIAMISLACASIASIAQARPDSAVPKTEELRNGRWVTVEQPATQPNTDPALRRIEDLIRDGRAREASALAVEWLKANPTSPVRDRALYLNAEALFRYGDRVKAFYYLDELMDTYPESPLFYRALEKQYQVADEFLPDENHHGYKSRFLGLPIIGREDEAIEMLYRIQQRSPGSALAEKALLRTADYYYADRQYDLAGDTYGAYARAYPRSPLTPRVKLRQALSNLFQFRGTRFDATPAIDARAQLSEVMALYPDLAGKENVPGLITKIDEWMARKLLVAADFYKRTSQPTAAVYLYRYLIAAYPTSPQAQQAKFQLTRMPARAIDTAAPAATRPVASAGQLNHR